MQSGSNNFRYLNREGKWLDFHSRGLEVTPEGALQLLSSPALVDESGSQLNGANMPDAPSGIAADNSGRVFYTIPDENRVMVIGGCDPEPVPLSCLTEGAGIGRLNKPRGLLVLRNPDRLVIADSGNDRVLFYDLSTFNLREVWGRRSWSSHIDDPNRFNNPWAVAASADGRNLYILDAGNRRILKFARTGESDTDFLENMRSSDLVHYPGALAVSGSGKKTRIFVSDLVTNQIFVFDDSGMPVPDAHGFPVVIQWPSMGRVLALAVSESRLYVGDNQQQRILSFSLEEGFPFSGDATGFHGHVTALAFDSSSDVLLAQTGAGKTLSLKARGAYLAAGFLWSDAISVEARPVTWDRLGASVTNAPGSHVEFYYAISDKPSLPTLDQKADNPFAVGWKTLPQDVEYFLLEGDRNPYLFIGASFFSDRTDTPQLTQMRVEFDAESYTRYLPAIYREPAPQNDFLRRFVGLFQGLFEDVEEEVESLERYFDPFAAPAGALTWLASWLAVDLDQGEPEARIRQNIARAFQRYQWRGTTEGLRRALLEDAGVHAVISEPISASSFWAMPRPADCSQSAAGGAPQLGSTTHLPTMQPGGAVLGSTAELDHSYLITDAQFGEPLFAGSASQFVVEVYRGEVNSEARLRLVKDIIEREKPAHTMYRLSFIDSTMRAGFQSRAGVDTVISGVPGPTPLGRHGGYGLRLSESLPPRIGTSHLGQDLKL